MRQEGKGTGDFVLGQERVLYSTVSTEGRDSCGVEKEGGGMLQ